MKYLRKFENNAAYESATLDLPNVAYCKEENEVHYNPIPDYSKEYLTFVAKESGTFTFTPKNSNIINYSTDNGETWTQGNSVSVNNGDKVLWKGTMTPQSNNGIGTFASTANFDVQGNAMSLLYGDNYKEQTSLTKKNFALYKLFNNNTKVVNAENLSLPAKTLATHCYENMFYGCTNLTTAPSVLPAITLTNWCYASMFNGCTSLTTVPKLPTETLADYCYKNMFQGCTSLTTVPELLATTLVGSCYEYMFDGCTSLTTVPELPATTLASYCYRNMFRGCTALTIAPELPATTLINGSYDSMFNGCTNLNYIKAMFTTTPSTSYTRDWVKGVSTTGTFVKNSAATWTTTGNNGIPTGWIVETASE